jgi:hypothetical protein
MPPQQQKKVPLQGSVKQKTVSYSQFIDKVFAFLITGVYRLKNFVVFSSGGKPLQKKICSKKGV